MSIPVAKWQLRVGPAVEAPVAALTKAGSRRVAWRLSEASTLDFTVPGRDPQSGHIAELASDVHLLRDDHVLYTGRVGGSTDEINDDQHTVTVPTADYRALLGRRLWPTEPGTEYAGDTGALARQLLDTTQAQIGGDLDIDTSAAPNTGTSIDRHIEGGSPTNVELDAAAIAGRPDSGFDWDIAPGWENRALQLFAPRRGTDRGVVLDYTYTGKPRSSIVAGLTRQVDPSEFANLVRVVGGTFVETRTIRLTEPDGSTSDEEIEVRHPTTPATAAGAIGPEGRWETRISDDQLVHQSEVDARVLAELARLQMIEPSYTIRLRQNAWEGPDHIWLGDTTRAIIRSGRLNEDLPLRVTEIALTLGDSGEEDVTLTVGPPRATLLRQIHAIYKRFAIGH